MKPPLRKAEASVWYKLHVASHESEPYVYFVDI